MALEVIPQSDKTTVGDYVYELIKRNIVRLKLEPGKRISENEISELLGVSRTPVREAFIKLSREDLLYVLPQRGTYVSQIDMTQVEEARFIREVLESAVLKLVTQGIDVTFIKLLEQNLEAQRRWTDADGFTTYMELDEKFHEIIFESVHKQRTWEVIEQVNTQYRRVRILSYSFNNMISSLIDQHAALLEAIRNRDEARGQEIISMHTRKLLHEQSELMERYPGYFKSK